MKVPVTPFLTRPQLAKRWFMSPRTLNTWAVRGEGPAYRVIGGRVLYRLEDVEAWETEQWGGVDSEAETGHTPDVEQARWPGRGRKPASKRGSKSA